MADPHGTPGQGSSPAPAAPKRKRFFEDPPPEVLAKRRAALHGAHQQQQQQQQPQPALPPSAARAVDPKELAARTLQEVREVYRAYNDLQDSLQLGGDASKSGPAFARLLAASSGTPGAKRLAARLVPRFLPKLLETPSMDDISSALTSVCHISADAQALGGAAKLVAGTHRDAMQGLGRLCSTCEEKRSSLHILVRGIQFLLKQLPTGKGAKGETDAGLSGLFAAFKGSPQAVTSVMLGLSVGKSSFIYMNRVVSFMRYLCEPDKEDAGGELRGRAVLEALPSAGAWLRASVASLKRDEGVVPKDVTAALEDLLATLPEPMETADDQAEELVGPHYSVVDRQWLGAHGDLLAEGSESKCEILKKSWRLSTAPSSSRRSGWDASPADMAARTGHGTQLPSQGATPSRSTRPGSLWGPPLPTPGKDQPTSAAIAAAAAAAARVGSQAGLSKTPTLAPIPAVPTDLTKLRPGLPEKPTLAAMPSSVAAAAANNSMAAAATAAAAAAGVPIAGIPRPLSSEAAAIAASLSSGPSGFRNSPMPSQPPTLRQPTASPATTPIGRGGPGPGMRPRIGPATTTLHLDGVPRGVAEIQLREECCRYGAVKKLVPFPSPTEDEWLVTFESIRDAANCSEALADTQVFGSPRPLGCTFRADGHPGNQSPFIWVGGGCNREREDQVVSQLADANLPPPALVLCVGGRRPGLIIELQGGHLVQHTIAYLSRRSDPPAGAYGMHSPDHSLRSGGGGRYPVWMPGRGPGRGGRGPGPGPGPTIGSSGLRGPGGSPGPRAMGPGGRTLSWPSPAAAAAGWREGDNNMHGSWGGAPYRPGASGWSSSSGHGHGGAYDAVMGSGADTSAAPPPPGESPPRVPPPPPPDSVAPPPPMSSAPAALRPHPPHLTVAKQSAPAAPEPPQPNLPSPPEPSSAPSADTAPPPPARTVTRAPPGQLAWQGQLAKSGALNGNVLCYALPGSQPSKSEPKLWPTCLDVVMRADLNYVVNTIYKACPPLDRVVMRMVAAKGDDQRKAFAKFMQYLAGKARAGVVKLPPLRAPAAGAQTGPRTMYLIPPSASVCQALEVPLDMSNDCMVMLVVPSSTK